MDNFRFDICGGLSRADSNRFESIQMALKMAEIGRQMLYGTYLRNHLLWWHEFYSLGFPIFWDYRKWRALAVARTSIHFHPNSSVSASCTTKTIQMHWNNIQLIQLTHFHCTTSIHISNYFQFNSCNPVWNTETTHLFEWHSSEMGNMKRGKQCEVSGDVARFNMPQVCTARKVCGSVCVCVSQ